MNGMNSQADTVTYSIFSRNTSESTAAFTKRSECWDQFTSWRLEDAYVHLEGLKTGRSLQGQVPDIPGPFIWFSSLNTKTDPDIYEYHEPCWLVAWVKCTHLLKVLWESLVLNTMWWHTCGSMLIRKNIVYIIGVIVHVIHLYAKSCSHLLQIVCERNSSCRILMNLVDRSILKVIIKLWHKSTNLYVYIYTYIGFIPCCANDHGTPDGLSPGVPRSGDDRRWPQNFQQLFVQEKDVKHDGHQSWVDTN